MFWFVLGVMLWGGDGGGKRVVSVIGKGSGDVDFFKNEIRGKIWVVIFGEGW